VSAIDAIAKYLEKLCFFYLFETKKLSRINLKNSDEVTDCAEKIVAYLCDNLLKSELDLL
jgi:hypothetical protein